jgi:pimeloyl-ACP methyl ester carboxylesterase
MKPRLLSLLAMTALVWSLIGTLVTARAAIEPCTGSNPIQCNGSFPEDGARYLIEVPAGWNGTLLLYSHGYTTNEAGPARDVGDDITRAWLLQHGYALAGTSYAHAGWALQEAFYDQVHVLTIFDQLINRHPDHTIAWGHSLGGIITAGLIQRNPELFDGALPMCGVLAGGVAVWNDLLDGAFVFKTLLAPNATYPKLVHYSASEVPANLGAAIGIIDAAHGSAQGKARIALVAAMGDVPGWFTGEPAEPAPDNFAARVEAQYKWLRNVDFGFAFGARVDLEKRAAGNPSWNTGVNYRKQLALSAGKDEVEALYEQAGLDLEADLNTLAGTQRIAADPGTLDYMIDNIAFNGDLGGVPVLTLHTSADGLVQVEQENAYADLVESVEQQRKPLEQVYVHRAGHCTFTPAEQVAALLALEQRISTGHWKELDPESLSAKAASLGPTLNPAPPAYFEFEPAVFPRQFDVRNLAMAAAA